jgi:hypothetical protein
VGRPVLDIRALLSFFCAEEACAPSLQLEDTAPVELATISLGVFL